MSNDVIERILGARQPEPEVEAVESGTKFFSALLGGTHEEHFLELQFRDGVRLCFSYNDFMWFNYDPEGGSLDMEFGGFLVTVEGRGLVPGLFSALKQKRVAWIREADENEEDNAQNEMFVRSIVISPPDNRMPTESKE